MTLEALSAAGILRTFRDAGVFEAADIHVAQRLTALGGEHDERVALAIALVVRALRGGSVCVDLRAVETQVGIPELPWPDDDDWLAAVAASRLLGTPPVLRLLGDLLYLDRYWLEEEQVCADLLALSAPGAIGDVAALQRLFPPGYEEQRELRANYDRRLMRLREQAGVLRALIQRNEPVDMTENPSAPHEDKPAEGPP